MLPRTAFAALALLLTAETSPPPFLTPYIKDGKFEPGDFAWMRGRFLDATPAEKTRWQALWAWRQQCHAEEAATVRAELSRRGITLSEPDQRDGNGLCGSFTYAQPQGSLGGSWLAFQAALARARPVAQAIVWSAALAQAQADPDKKDLPALLIARPVEDGVLRAATSWDLGEVTGAPALDPTTRGIATGLIWRRIGERDHANTAWLKALVATQGWPKVSTVGAPASHMAWLIVQHADDDPSFQLDILRLIEPLALHGEVAAKDYAYLYDRVMLKLTGKQRYGSQMTCLGGKHVPLPLEDASHLDSLRDAMSMGKIAAYTARIDQVYGSCPAETTPPSSAH